MRFSQFCMIFLMDPVIRLSFTVRREHRGHNPDVRIVSSSNPSRPAAGHAVKFRKFHVSQMENVSILFADIVGFTNMSSNKSASQLLLLLNDLFGR